ncbi:IS4 family transposase [Acaryochloris marina]|uniref:Uncharacterized protein n=1 Tax=Acaryochloris marina (strain MBIC 11017) TaxID=329726 RepID=B0C709_ACAM1|nr:IS4-like element ISAcma18 family transposase [Acaryochloris marina]ABW28848.1 conserved hypothetical protein [Acaryochloris marina MBIC11017]ABW31204.1 conserved hypothetical protein [Acaryochloris marina MBIC11017]
MKTNFSQIITPHCHATAHAITEEEITLCVGDTSFLDYGGIKKKRQGYGPQGNGGNGLLLHSALAVDPEQGQPLGLLWQKVWNRQHRPQPPKKETPRQKKKRQAKARQTSRNRPFEQKASYRWVEAMQAVEKIVSPSTRSIHVFDREGDIAEVFERLNHLNNTGVVVRASHNRRLEQDPNRLWKKLEAQSIQFEYEIDLPKTKDRSARIAKLVVRCCLVQLQRPTRLADSHPLQVYAVYATEVDPPEDEDPVSWMLLTSEAVTTMEMAQTILRWYTYRWRVEEYHKILKSGTQVERYRLAAEGMKTLLGFLCVTAVELLRWTYLERTSPQRPAQDVVTPLQIKVLRAKTSKVPKNLTVAWAVKAVARLGGYLEHRRNTPMGIQVLWKGWAKLNLLVEGWQLATQET